MLSKKVPLYFSFFSMLIGAALVFVIFYALSKNPSKAKGALATNIIEQSTSCDFSVVRLSGFHFVKPLLYTDQGCEAPRFASLKSEIANLTETLKSNGAVSTLSVYLRVFKQGEWMAYKPEEVYKPGSLLKVPVLITFLRMAEVNPAIMNKQVVFEGHNSKLPQQQITTETLKAGRKYSMKELIYFMIVHSDNDATALLESQITNQEFQKTFVDLGLTSQNKDEKGAYLISAKDYSVFLKVLYNASYLNIKDSEYATSLLGETNYNEALAKGLPAKTQVAHKFGESGNLKEHQLHDAGIIYVNDMPYILTIMTKGADLKKLSDAIAQVSKLVYTSLTSN